MELIDYLLGYPPGDLKIFPFMIQKRLVLILERLKYLEQVFAKTKLFNLLSTYRFERYMLRYSKYLSYKIKSKKYIPVILSGWDNTPRYGYRGFFLLDFRVQSLNSYFLLFGENLKKLKKNFS